MGRSKENPQKVPPESHIVLTTIKVDAEQKPGFVAKATDIFTRATDAPGILHQGLHATDGSDGVTTFYTRTAWESPADIERFKESQPHVGAMENVGAYGTDFRTARLIGDTVPSWEEVIARFNKPQEKPGK